MHALPQRVAMFTRFNAFLAKYCMIVAVIGLYAIVAAVAYEVFGRYVMKDTPTWAESLTLVLILYVALFGAAVGVRDAGHIGMESLLVLVSERWRLRLEFVIHVLVAAFGALMVAGGWGLMSGVLLLNCMVMFMPCVNVTSAMLISGNTPCSERPIA